MRARSHEEHTSPRQTKQTKQLVTTNERSSERSSERTNEQTKTNERTNERTNEQTTVGRRCFLRLPADNYLSTTAIITFRTFIPTDYLHNPNYRYHHRFVCCVVLTVRLFEGGALCVALDSSAHSQFHADLEFTRSLLLTYNHPFYYGTHSLTLGEL